MNISKGDNKGLLREHILEKAYKNSNYSSKANIFSAQLLDSKIELLFISTEALTVEDIAENIKILNKWGGKPEINNIKIVDKNSVEISGGFNLEDAPYRIKYGANSYQVVRSWLLIDQKYSYKDDLGPELKKDGTALLSVWSPEADSVSLRLYDKDDQYEVIKDNLKMIKNEQGVWQLRLNKENTGIENLKGFYYHYLVEHNGKISAVLDPYAPSMAAWKYHPSDEGPEYKSGKGAILNPGEIGPELDYAEIDNFAKREDAVIYEVHVRDLTSSPAISAELESQFGTFAAFKEKLDYIESLGVTHIQLMPIMSYYFGDETANDERLL